MELVGVVLLATATIATAWAAYQGRQWTGEQAHDYSVGTASRIAENRAAALARFYRSRFRDEFKPAFASWLATRPFTAADAPKTPFEMPQYRLAATDEADRLEATAAGISTRFATPAIRRAVLGLGAVVLIVTLVWLATFPVELTPIG